jgi:hypothetical protein
MVQRQRTGDYKLAGVNTPPLELRRMQRAQLELDQRSRGHRRVCRPTGCSFRKVLRTAVRASHRGARCAAMCYNEPLRKSSRER